MECLLSKREEREKKRELYWFCAYTYHVFSLNNKQLQRITSELLSRLIGGNTQELFDSSSFRFVKVLLHFHLGFFCTLYSFRSMFNFFLYSFFFFFFNYLFKMMYRERIEGEKYDENEKVIFISLFKCSHTTHLVK